MGTHKHPAPTSERFLAPHGRPKAMILDDAAQEAILSRLDTLEAAERARDIIEQRRERQVAMLVNSGLDQHEAIRQIINALEVQRGALEMQRGVLSTLAHKFEVPKEGTP